MWKKKIVFKKLTLVLVLLMIVTINPNTAFGDGSDTLRELNAQGKMSNEYMNRTIIDLADISDGSVVTYTYIGENQTLTKRNLSVADQTYTSARNKLTRFNFELRKYYYPETSVWMSGYISEAPDTVHYYTYGPQKDIAMWSLVDGISDCLNGTIDTSSNNSDNDNGNGSWFDKYTPENIDETVSESPLEINGITLEINGMELTKTVIGEDGNTTTTTIEMDIQPEIIYENVFVPIRPLAYALGITDEGIKWNNETKTVIITKNETTIELTINSNIEIVNGEQIEMDVAPYIKETDLGGRTMLPANYIAEPLDVDVIQTTQIN